MISLIAAASENNCIGKQGEIPWDLPKDFKHFHDATKGKPIVMGRKTHESIGRVLPGRKNVVVTRQDMEIEGCEVVHSIEEALELLKDESEVCIIGGGQIYVQALPFANQIDLTRVHTEVEGGDAFFPEFNTSSTSEAPLRGADEWQLISQERHEADEDHNFAYTFMLYKKNNTHAAGGTHKPRLGVSMEYWII
ncbi:dihydrofolate reductase [Patescibacteria group bacterium]|nr:dihydrofolate reductase [Patescibacteria group bacterium]MBU1123046.1 dihydrofolate reductase [Patescibacteria group bacterium]MBU1911351.1 dihydrofolate reductase [Patescibacteria group bacterium]